MPTQRQLDESDIKFGYSLIKEIITLHRAKQPYTIEVILLTPLVRRHKEVRDLLQRVVTGLKKDKK